MRPPQGLRLVRHRATTAQVGVAYPGVTGRAPITTTVPLGIEATGAGPFRYDPFALYECGVLSNPNMLVAGEPGSGKSAAVKAMLHRWTGLRNPDAPPRWIAVCDPKGEYTALAEALSLDVIRLRPGGLQRLNPLAAAPERGGDSGAAADRRYGALSALMVTLLQRPLTPLEDAALGWTVDELSRRHDEPVLADVAHLLANPTEAIARRGDLTPAALAEGAAAVRFGLGKLIDRDLRGMFDGPSTVRVADDSPGIVIDLSVVHADRTALALVMVAATGWLQATLIGRTGCQKVQVIDEAWALLANTAAVGHLQASWKLCRDYGVANIAVTHRFSDLRAQADDGTALAKVAGGLLADTQTKVLFRQAPDQVPETKALLDLSDTEADILPRLARGRALWRVAGEPFLVQHVVTDAEWSFCDTDAVLTRRGSSETPQTYRNRTNLPDRRNECPSGTLRLKSTLHATTQANLSSHRR